MRSGELVCRPRRCTSARRSTPRTSRVPRSDRPAYRVMVEWDQDLEEALQQQGMGSVPRIDEVRLLVTALTLIEYKDGQKPLAESLRMFQQDRRRVALTTLEWTKTDEGHWRARGSNGSIYLIHDDSEDGEHRLVFGWNGYGAIDLGSGPRSELARRAQQLAREGDPPGGPDPEESSPHPWYEWRGVRGTLRRAGNVGELVIDIGYHVLRAPDDHVLYCGYRDGSFAIIARGADRNLVPLGDKLSEDDHLRELRPSVMARLGELTIPWRFLDQSLYKGIIPTPKGDFLLLDIGNGAYALIFAYGSGKYVPIALRPLELIQTFDLAPILKAIVGKRAFDDWVALMRLKKPASAERREIAKPSETSSPFSSQPSRTSSASTRTSPMLPSAPADIPSSQLPSAGATSFSLMPQGSRPATASRAPEARPPQIDTEALVLEHLKVFHQRLPIGENGVATARAYLIGLVRRYLAGDASIEGTWRDVFAPFVESGDLDDMPSDKTARAALSILKASPLVRRIDHQRWRICLDEARDPRSEVIHVLLREQLDRKS